MQVFCGIELKYLSIVAYIEIRNKPTFPGTYYIGPLGARVPYIVGTWGVKGNIVYKQIGRQQSLSECFWDSDVGVYVIVLQLQSHV